MRRRRRKKKKKKEKKKKKKKQEQSGILLHDNDLQVGLHLLEALNLRLLLLDALPQCHDRAQVLLHLGLALLDVALGVVDSCLHRLRVKTEIGIIIKWQMK
jgi:hypothetical protein